MTIIAVGTCTAETLTRHPSDVENVLAIQYVLLNFFGKRWRIVSATYRSKVTTDHAYSIALIYL